MKQLFSCPGNVCGSVFPVAKWECIHATRSSRPVVKTTDTPVRWITDEPVDPAIRWEREAQEQIRAVNVAARGRAAAADRQETAVALIRAAHAAAWRGATPTTPGWVIPGTQHLPAELRWWPATR